MVFIFSFFFTFYLFTVSVYFTHCWITFTLHSLDEKKNFPVSNVCVLSFWGFLFFIQWHSTCSIYQWKRVLCRSKTNYFPDGAGQCSFSALYRKSGKLKTGMQVFSVIMPCICWEEVSYFNFAFMLLYTKLLDAQAYTDRPYHYNSCENKTLYLF
jgi:hypothetical protein